MHVHAFFAVGIMVVALVGYLARTWWVYQICLSITTLPFVLCCWMLPETPFWLLTEGRYEEAQKVVNIMARWNKVNTPCKISELFSVQDDLVCSRTGDNRSSSMKKHNILDLFRNWPIARRTISLWLVWFTGSLGYYVFSLSSVNLGGSEYLNLFLIGKYHLLFLILEQAYKLYALEMSSNSPRSNISYFQTWAQFTSERCILLAMSNAVLPMNGLPQSQMCYLGIQEWLLMWLCFR